MFLFMYNKVLGGHRLTVHICASEGKGLDRERSLLFILYPYVLVRNVKEMYCFFLLQGYVRQNSI